MSNGELSKQKETITPIGEVHHRGVCYKFGIKLDDRRRHSYIIGKTGVGKSTLLENMAIADIEAGRGVGVIDPHGEFCDTILDFIPEERLEDVVYFDPSDTEFPIGFNPLEKVSDEHRHLVASSMMGVFKKIWPDVWSTRMEYILNNTLLALLEYPGATLIGILRMFAEKEYLDKVVEGLEDPVVKSFWEREYAKYPERYRTEAIGAVQNKVGQFVTNPLIRNILGQPYSSINVRKIMDEEKIFIVNLSKGKIGEDNMALLGGMIIAKIQLAAMSRAKQSAGEHKDFFLSVDEFQNFATDSFAGILSEARKYHLNLTLAHQYINQLIFDGNTKVRDAVMGNIGTFVCFRVGADDADFLEKEFLPDYDANDLVNLPKYHILVRMTIDGINSPPFSAKTIAPREKREESPREVIVDYSRKKYAKPRTHVEKKIRDDWSSSEISPADKSDFAGMPLDEIFSDKAVQQKQKGVTEPKKPKKPKKDPNVNIDSLRNLLRSALSKESAPEVEEETKEETL